MTFIETNQALIIRSIIMIKNCAYVLYPTVCLEKETTEEWSMVSPKGECVELCEVTHKQQSVIPSIKIKLPSNQEIIWRILKITLSYSPSIIIPYVLKTQLQSAYILYLLSFML